YHFLIPLLHITCAVNINTLAKGISVEMRLWRMGAKRYDRAVLRGVFLFGSEVKWSPYSNYLKKLNYGSSPPFLPDHTDVQRTQNGLCAFGVVTARHSRSRGVSPR
ncbi:TPA: hypothetical protein ACK1ZA_004659, partial [Enterobacter asburiae]